MLKQLINSALYTSGDWITYSNTLNDEIQIYYKGKYTAFDESTSASLLPSSTNFSTLNHTDYTCFPCNSGASFLTHTNLKALRV